MSHYSVLLDESVAALAIKPAGIYVDGTFGRGGHSSAILSRLDASGRLIAFDKDLAAHQSAAEQFAAESRLTMQHASFAELHNYAAVQGLIDKLDGVLLDLGVSSPQLDQADRGFSFLHDGPLDMRMDQTQALTAAQFIEQAEVHEIAKVLQVYGEEKFARLIASRIVEHREREPFTSTHQLADFIAAVIPKRAQRSKSRAKAKHPATRSFQAIRIHVNQELKDLEEFLSHIVELLAVGGRLVVVSFHSLEDRMVKRFIKAQERGPSLPRHLPIQSIDREPHLVSCGKALKADEQELLENVRSRSAVLRIAEKVAGGQAC